MARPLEPDVVREALAAMAFPASQFTTGTEIDTLIRNNAGEAAAQLLALTGPTASWSEAGRAFRLYREMVEGLRWRQAWAAMALRALTAGDRLTPGSGLAIECTRECLREPRVHVALRAERLRVSAADVLKREELALSSVSPEETPFTDDVFTTTLHALDAIVAVQDASPRRLEDIRSDAAVRVSRPPLPLALFDDARRLAARTGRDVGWAMMMLLVGDAERRGAQDDHDAVADITTWAPIVAARYGRIADWLLAVEKALVGVLRAAPGTHEAWLAIALDHLRYAAEWLDDPQVDAVVNHGLAAVLRTGVRGVDGLVEAVAHMQRAVTRYEQLGQEVQALGAQVDLASVLLRAGPCVGGDDDVTPEVRQWDRYAEAYLTDAIGRLTDRAEDSLAMSYVGEAFHNRARLHEQLGASAAACADARNGLVLARHVDDIDLQARLMGIVSRTADDPLEAVESSMTAAKLVQTIRHRTTDETTAVRLLGNKVGVFEAQLRLILKHAGRTITNEQACGLLVTALETGRGLTYNRWLEVEPVSQLPDVMSLLADDDSDQRPVLALYVVTGPEVALVVLDAGRPPTLERLEMSGKELVELVRAHLTGLRTHRFAPRSDLWDATQRRFCEAGWRLVAPLEPYVAAGRPVCVIPHGALHASALHMLPTAPGGEPIGLRTPVFQNPSVTNWAAARAAEPPAARVYVGCAAPESELRHFDDVDVARRSLAATGLEVDSPKPEATDIVSLQGSGWAVLHLASHGVFREDRDEAGLLLAHDRTLPPSPADFRSEEHRDHLARPQDLRRSLGPARLVFLASCLSSRNRELLGDDLLGTTRAVFAAGAGDLIAGGWTVVSSTVSVFADALYSAVGAGLRASSAVHRARLAVAEHHPNPFLWGAFIHQGAGGHVLAATKGKPS